MAVTSNDGAMDILSGVFEAPLGGIYVFHAHVVRRPNSEGRISIRKNGVTTSHVYDHDDKFWGSTSTSVLLSVDQGDKIDVQVTGKLRPETQFSGFLLQLSNSAL